MLPEVKGYGPLQETENLADQEMFRTFFIIIILNVPYSQSLYYDHQYYLSI